MDDEMKWGPSFPNRLGGVDTSGGLEKYVSIDAEKGDKTRRS